MARKQNFQTVAWFWDLYQRDRLDLDPPYQRRSVWNQTYKDYFIDTVLLGYPAPAIFLFEEIEPDGITMYHVVDGKQRLITLFDFVDNVFPVSSDAQIADLRDIYFNALDDDMKRSLWGYQFSVEYITTNNQSMINNIFDRINRNTAKLSSQELRHAKFSGDFVRSSEELSDWMTGKLGEGFPNIARKYRRQMKDVELVSTLFLLLEQGPRGTSTTDLDEAFSARDETWTEKDRVVDRFRQIVNYLKQVLETENGQDIQGSRLRNQAGFYSLFGAIDSLMTECITVAADEASKRLVEFVDHLSEEDTRLENENLRTYYEAARSASNDTGPRRSRIMILKGVLTGQEDGGPTQ